MNADILPFESSFSVGVLTPVSRIKELAQQRGWKYFRISFDDQLEHVRVTRISRLAHEREYLETQQ